MDKRIVAIYDPDPEFVFRFMEFAKMRSAFTMDVRAFTTEAPLCLAADKTPPDLLLVSSSVLTDAVKALPAKQLVVLQEEPFIQEDQPQVYKYQPPEELLKKVWEFCKEERDRAPVYARREGMEIIGFYSPVARSRKTTLALTMGQILAGDRSVLYLNLETFAGFEGLFSEQYERTLSDLLYFGRQKEVDLEEKLRGIVRTLQKMDYVPPACCPDDLQSLSPEEWLALFQKIEKDTHYEVLLLDFGEAVQGLLSLLAACDRIYMPIRQDPVSGAKLEQFFWLLEASEGKEVEGKIRKMKLPFCRNEKTGKAFFEDLVWSELGDLVRKELGEEGKV